MNEAYCNKPNFVVCKHIATTRLGVVISTKGIVMFWTGVVISSKNIATTWTGVVISSKDIAMTPLGVVISSKDIATTHPGIVISNKDIAMRWTGLMLPRQASSSQCVSAAMVRRWHPLRVWPWNTPSIHSQKCTHNWYSIGCAQHTPKSQNMRIRLICSPPLKVLITTPQKCISTQQSQCTYNIWGLLCHNEWS